MRFKPGDIVKFTNDIFKDKFHYVQDSYMYNLSYYEMDTFKGDPLQVVVIDDLLYPSDGFTLVTDILREDE